MNSNSDESNKKPSIPNAIDPEKLAGMEFVAKMRATADKYGAGFIGGFKDPKTGELFINSNIDENDPIYQRTKRKLKDSDPEQ
tara:strand:- start:228 stop:476 length:249 start_codon:yes stop_codon:yes gene_type:complete